jgi:hypothetical protein
MGGEPTFAGSRTNDKVAPIPDLPALALERGGSTHSGCRLDADESRRLHRPTFQNAARVILTPSPRSHKNHNMLDSSVNLSGAECNGSRNSFR